MPALEPPKEGEEGGSKPEWLALEAADGTAIEEVNFEQPAQCSLLHALTAALNLPWPQVNLAYEAVKEVDGLDISKEGSEAWESAMKRYDERIDRVETRITARLR